MPNHLVALSLQRRGCTRRLMLDGLSERDEVKPMAPGFDGTAGDLGPSERCHRAWAGSRATHPGSPITLTRTAAWGQLGTQIDVITSAIEEVEVLLERLPGPGQAFVQRRAGDVLDAFHETDEPFMI